MKAFVTYDLLHQNNPVKLELQVPDKYHCDGYAGWSFPAAMSKVESQLTKELGWSMEGITHLEVRFEVDSTGEDNVAVQE